MAVSPGTSNSTKRIEFARAMNTIAIVSVATGIGGGGTAGGMYNSAKTANASTFAELYKQTRNVAYELLTYDGWTGNKSSFIDTKAKLIDVTGQIKAKFFGCAYPLINTSGHLPSSWGAWPICGTVVPTEYDDTVYDDLPDDTGNGDGGDDMSLVVDGTGFSDTSIATKVGIGVAVTALAVGLLVAISRR
mgnify:FL=1